MRSAQGGFIAKARKQDSGGPIASGQVLQPLTWHFAQLPLVSNAGPAGLWQAPQEVLAASAGLCRPVLKSRGALESCLNSLSWHVLQSALARFTCAA